MKKFWKWKNQAQTETTPAQRTLYLNGTIAEESWFDDDVTPQLFKEELNSGSGDINDYTSGQHTKLLKTKTVRVNHNADGTKSGVALSAYWRFSGTYSGTAISSITASTTITLDNVEGKISDERFAKMSATYEAEQAQLTERAAELEKLLSDARQKAINADYFLSLVRKYTDIQELDAQIIREFVEKILVFKPEKVNGRRVQRIRIIYNCIGAIDIPGKDEKTA